MTVYDTKLAHTNRKIPVGTRLRLIYQDSSRTVHRLHSKILLVNNSCVHILLIMIPVSTCLPQMSAQHNRSRNFHVSVLCMNFTPVLQKSVFERHTFRQEERESRSFFSEHKKSQFFSKFSMVTLFRFFQPLQIFIQIGFFCERSSVDSCEHLVLFISAPVSARKACQLKRFDRLCIHQMRSRAQVREFTLLIEADNCVFRKIFNKFYLIWLFFLLHQSNRFLSWKRKALNRKRFFHDLLHFFFNLFQIFCCKWNISVHIIVKAVRNGWPNSKLRLRIEALYCLCQNMRGCMTEGIFPSFVLKCQNIQLTVLGHYRSEIHYFPVYFSCHCHSGKSFADVRCNLIH